MSTGKEQQKARTNKVAHGWEEAGSEFYQESFPTDLDNTIITRDPTAIATLLPSKQNRAGKYDFAFFSFFSISPYSFILILCQNKLTYVQTD